MQADQENKKLLLFLFSKKLDTLEGKSECFFIPIFLKLKAYLFCHEVLEF